jgi:hypothetical protein
MIVMTEEGVQREISRCDGCGVLLDRAFWALHARSHPDLVDLAAATQYGLGMHRNHQVMTATLATALRDVVQELDTLTELVARHSALRPIAPAGTSA